MTTADLLHRLRDAGITLAAVGDQLRVSAPPGALTDEFRDAIRAHKPALLQLLAPAAGAPGGAPPVAPVPRDAVLPVSFAQQRLWFMELLEPGRATFTIPVTWRLRGPLDARALRRALDALVARHETLRTVFDDRRGEPCQVIRDPHPAALVVTDLAAMAPAARDARLAIEVADEATRPFDLREGPLFRARLWVLGPADHVLQLDLHHAIADGWSVGILARELGPLYAEAAGGAPAALPPLALQYVDAAAAERAWLEGEAWRPQLDFWTARLAGAPERLQVPADHPRPAEQSRRGAMVRRTVPPALHQAILAAARREQASDYAVLLTAFVVLLHRYTRETDLVVGTPVANRTRVEFESIVGLFVNLVALRADLSGNPAFRDVLARVRRSIHEAVAHQALPFDRLVEELSPSRSASANPIFQVAFVQQDDRERPRLPGIAAEPLPVTTPTSKYDLTMFGIATEDGLDVGLEYATDLFDAASIDRLLDHYLRLLEAAVTDPARRVGELPLMDEAERDLVLRVFNDPERYPLTRPVPLVAADTLPELFERRVAEAPDAVALTCGDESMTYAALDAQANRVARRLRAMGVGPNVLVGLCLERGNRLLVALLGILKAGGAYLPIDLAYPADRLAFMLEDGEARVLLTERAIADRVPGRVANVLFVDDLLAAPAAAGETEALPPVAGPDDLAYVIYTSGTTGRPKGSQLTHRNVVSLFVGTDRLYEFGPGDVWTLFHSYAFDFSVWEIWGALLFGGRLVVVPFLVTRATESFYDLVAREGVTILNQTPSAFRQFIQAEALAGQKPLALRAVILGGEALEMRSLAPWFDRHGDRAPRVINMYGITETTVFVTHRPLEAADVASASVIGVPIPLWDVYIVDPYGQPAPVGVPGEIYVGGAGVSKGYLHRDDLNREKFVPNPFDDRSPTLYRSGDLARYLPDGDIEYIGRIDQQVKIRGFRIEIGEIESVLASHPDVAQGAVIARPDAHGQAVLVAYVVPRGAMPAAEDLREHLRAALPDYMLPIAWVAMDALPLTANGKLDVRALPAPGEAEAAGAAYEAPRTGTETRLAALWAELLQVPRVGRHDDFFLVGGHSLLAMRLVHRVHDAFGVALPVGALFEHPVLERLAAEIDARRAAAEAGTEPADSTGRILVRMEEGGHGTPFFWVHGVGGETYQYMAVAKHLGKSRPVYGFTADWTRMPAEETRSLREIAARYLRELRRVKPEGPYHLGAFCNATPLALEMVRQLEEAGEGGGLFASLGYDLRPPSSSPTGIGRVAAFVRHLPGWITGDALPSGWRDLRGRIRSRLRTLAGAGKLADGLGRAPDIRDRLGMWRFPDYSIRMLEYHHQRIGEFTPEPIEGAATVVLPAAHPLFGPWLRGPHDEWRRLARGGVTVHVVPGSHSGILSDPFAGRVAAIIDEAIREVEARAPAPARGIAAQAMPTAG